MTPDKNKSLLSRQRGCPAPIYADLTDAIIKIIELEIAFRRRRPPAPHAASRIIAAAGRKLDSVAARFLEINPSAPVRPEP